MIVKKSNTKDLDSTVKKIIEVATKTYNSNPMFGDKYAELKPLVSEFIEMIGGHSHIPDELKTKVTDTKDLVELFYHRCTQLDPGKNIQFYRNDLNVDLRAAKLFVESRKEACGYATDVAVKTCAEIINTMFCNIDEFHFNSAISFTIFGQDKMSWVTEHTQRLIEKRKEYEKEEEMNQLEEENQKWLLAKVERGEVKLGMLDENENENDDYIARWRQQHPEYYNKKKPDPVAELHEYLKNKPQRVVKKEELGEEKTDKKKVDPVAAAMAHFEMIRQNRVKCNG
jgi:hypothetical protein